MSAPAVIDSLEFARAGQQVTGSLPVARLKRLHDCLHDVIGQVDYEVSGGHDERHRPQLLLHITAVLHLQCQRCLGALEHRLDVRSSLLLVQPQEIAGEELNDPEAPDVVEASPELDLAELVEEEILLSLPLAPRHADDGCASALEHPGRIGGTPFAKLAGLKDTIKKS